MADGYERMVELIEEGKDQSEEFYELDEALTCAECGFLKITEEQAHELEELWSSSSPGGKPVYVELCTCA